MAEVDAEQVVQAANLLGDTPYSEMDGAQQMIATAELPFLSFGVVGSLMFAGGYDAAQKGIAQNLTDGLEKYEAMVNGLGTVARNFHASEQANTVTAYSAQPGDPGSVGTTGIPPELGALAILLSAQVGTAAIGTMATISLCAALEPMCIVGAVCWALFIPNDENLNTAHAHWARASELLGGVVPDMTAGTNKLNAAWKDTGSDTAKGQFDTFLGNFQQEITETHGQVSGNATTLESVTKALELAAFLALATCLVSLLSLVLFTACEAIPVVGAVFTILKKILGFAESISKSVTVTIIGLVLASVAAFYLANKDKKFTGEKPEEGGKTTDFVDVTLDVDFSSVQPPT